MPPVNILELAKIHTAVPMLCPPLGDIKLDHWGGLGHSPGNWHLHNERKIHLAEWLTNQ